jgi:hypothetical protein
VDGAIPLIFFREVVVHLPLQRKRDRAGEVISCPFGD